MQIKKELFYFLGLVGVFTVFTVFFIFENLIVILEEASSLSVRPIRHKIPQSMIYEKNLPMPHVKLKFDIYEQPLQKNQNLYPVVVFIPGGFWQGHNKKNYSHIAGVLYKEKIITVVAQLPRYPGFITRHLYKADTLKKRGFQGQIDALQKLFFWIHDNISTFQGDVNRLSIVGFGSGAQLIISLFFLSQEKNKKLNEIKKCIQKLIFFSPIFDITQTDVEFHKNHIQEIFQDIDLKRLSFFDKKIGIDLPILLFSPEKDFHFLHEQARQFAESQKNVKYQLIKDESRRSLIFKLGRKDLATGLLIKFLQ